MPVYTYLFTRIRRGVGCKFILEEIIPITVESRRNNIACVTIFYFGDGSCE
jgi:hypothetical protein